MTLIWQTCRSSTPMAALLLTGLSACTDRQPSDRELEALLRSNCLPHASIRSLSCTAITSDLSYECYVVLKEDGRPNGGKGLFVVVRGSGHTLSIARIEAKTD